MTASTLLQAQHDRLLKFAIDSGAVSPSACRSAQHYIALTPARHCDEKFRYSLSALWRHLTKGVYIGILSAKYGSVEVQCFSEITVKDMR